MPQTQTDISTSNHTERLSEHTRIAILCMILVAMMAISSSCLHEFGSLLYMNVEANLRAISCLSHTMGFVIGMAVSYIVLRKPWTNKSLFWIAVYLLHLIYVGAFYVCFEYTIAPVIITALQFITSATASLFICRFIQIIANSSAKRFAIAICAIALMTAVIVYAGYALFLEFDLISLALSVHLVALVIAALILLYLIQIDAFTNTEETETIAHERAYLAKTPLLLLMATILLYQITFGIFHATPLAITTLHSQRIQGFFLGIILASLMVYLFFKRNRSNSFRVYWQCLYRVVFPFTVVANLLLIVLHENQIIIPNIFATSASFYFTIIAIMFARAVWLETKISPLSAFAITQFVAYTGYAIGIALSILFHRVLTIDTTLYGVLGIVIFLMLYIATFETHFENYAKTAWGLIPKRTALEQYLKTIDSKCYALAQDAGLTDKETEVLTYLAKGKKAKDISNELVVSINTTRTHIQAIYTKLDIHSNSELISLVNSVILTDIV